jgi:hypothetical protein
VSDRSLDEFVTGPSDDDAAPGAGDGDGAPRADDGQQVDRETSIDPTGTADSTVAADPASPTMRWTADGAACEDCGATVSRRWRAEGEFVCADCKEW